MDHDFMSKFYCYPTIKFPDKELIDRFTSLQTSTEVSDKPTKQTQNDIYKALISVAKILKQLPKNAHPQVSTDIAIIAIIRQLNIRGRYKDWFTQWSYSKHLYYPLQISAVRSALQSVVQAGNIPKISRDAINRNLGDACSRLIRFMPTVARAEDGSYTVIKRTAKTYTYATAKKMARKAARMAKHQKYLEEHNNG